MLALRGVVKRFGSVHALDGVDFDVRAGEVHALLGENGAGKTTLMNIACGVHGADAGSVSVAGETVDIRTPRDASRHGLGIVHQHYRLVPSMTVAENLHIGWEAAPRVVSQAAMQEATAELGARFGLAVDPNARVETLSVGEQQRVAILRALARGARILVLDEPTAVLTPAETRTLFAVIRSMAAEGKAIVFISHKLDEVVEISDRISVLRGGRRIRTLAKAECDTALLARLMIGHEVPTPRPRGDSGSRNVVLALDGVGLTDHRGLAALAQIDLSVHEREVVGVAGVSGNGQVELAEVMTGLLEPTTGTIRIGDADVTGAAPRDFIAAGVGHVPEDLKTGLALSEPIELNAVMKAVAQPLLRRGPFLSSRRIRSFCGELLSSARLEHVNTSRRAATLSGGQAQRLLVQRELLAGRRAIVAVHPTRGLDVDATYLVHEALLAARDRGAGVVLVSEDLDEILTLSDRIVVVYEGRIVGSFDGQRADREHIGLLMGGAAPGREQALQETRP